jgi:hypothetical protein
LSEQPVLQQLGSLQVEGLSPSGRRKIARLGLDEHDLVRRYQFGTKQKKRRSSLVFELREADPVASLTVETELPGDVG